jgi:hypothetical protein
MLPERLRQHIGVGGGRGAEAQLVGLHPHHRRQPRARLVHLLAAQARGGIGSIGLHLALAVEARQPVDHRRAGVAAARVLEERLPRSDGSAKAGNCARTNSTSSVSGPGRRPAASESPSFRRSLGRRHSRQQPHARAPTGASGLRRLPATAPNMPGRHQPRTGAVDKTSYASPTFVLRESYACPTPCDSRSPSKTRPHPPARPCRARTVRTPSSAFVNPCDRPPGALPGGCFGTRIQRSEGLSWRGMEPISGVFPATGTMDINAPVIRGSDPGAVPGGSTR